MLLLALVLIAAPAATPTLAADTYPTGRGTAGVSFFLPGGSDTRLIGATYFIANDMAAKFDLGINAALAPSGPGQNVLFTLGAGLRLYQLKRDRVALFLQPGVS